MLSPKEPIISAKWQKICILIIHTQQVWKEKELQKLWAAAVSLGADLTLMHKGPGSAAFHLPRPLWFHLAQQKVTASMSFRWYKV